MSTTGITRGRAWMCTAIAAAAAIGMTLAGGSAHGAPTTSTPSPSTSGASDPAPAPGKAGTVFANRQIPRANLVPGAASGNIFTYWSTGADDKPHLSSGVLLLPFTPAPAGGYPVVAWAHGSRGLADTCAPTTHPTAEDLDQAKTWLGRGYAVISSDYAGLGTEGVPQYFDSDATARNIVDAVRAGHDIADNLSRSWAVVGRGQGAAAAVALARIATALQGPELDFRGAAASSIPAQFSTLLTRLGPGTTTMPAGLTADALFTLSAISRARPEVDVVDYLTDSGRQWINKAADLCVAELTRQVDGVPLGSLFSKPLSGNRELGAVLQSASELPVRGFTRPVLMAQGLVDPTVVVPLTFKYINDARIADSHVTPRPYLVFQADQADAMAANDFRWFVNRLMQ